MEQERKPSFSVHSHLSCSALTCVIDVVNDQIRRLTAGAVTITEIEVPPSLFHGSSHFLLLSLHQPPDHLLFVGRKVMLLRQKGASGQVVVWVFHCTKLLGRQHGSRKVDWMVEEEGMVMKKGERAGEGGQDEAGRQKRLSQEAKVHLAAFVCRHQSCESVFRETPPHPSKRLHLDLPDCMRVMMYWSQTAS